LADLAGILRPLPQVLINVGGVDKARAASDDVLAQAVASARERLGEDGRVLLRPSGTEPLVRVMVEATTNELAHETADGLAAIVRDRLALPGAGHPR
jgi:phosphoglucosamine mutase